MKTKTKALLPLAAAAVGGYFLYKHFTAQKAAPVAPTLTSIAQQAITAALQPAPVNGLNGLGAYPFASHLAPIKPPSAFWAAGGWVGDTVTKPGRNFNVFPQVAPNIVDAYIGAGGTAIVGVAPPGAQEVKVMVDNSGTVLQVLSARWKSPDNVAGMGGYGGMGGIKFNLNKVGQAATSLTTRPMIASIHQARNLALPAAHVQLLRDPNVMHNLAAAVATTGAAHLVGSHINVAGQLQAGPGGSSQQEVTALTDAAGHVLATYATKSGQTAQAGITSFQSAPGTPTAPLSGLGSLGFSFSHAIKAVEQTVAAPLKITVATLKTTIAPAAALVTLAKTGSFSAATATLKTDLTAIPTAGKSIASNLISTAKSATAKPTVATPTGVQATATPGSLPGDPAGASWPVDATTASGWPGTWTNVPTGAAGWQYGDVGDGTGDGLLQNVGLAVSFSATPAMISAAGGNPATVVSQYLTANPTAAGAVNPATGLPYPVNTTINPATGLPMTPSTPTTAGSAQSYAWPASWTIVPTNTTWQYMAAQDGTGNGTFMNAATGQTLTATPAQIQAYAGNPGSVLSSLLGTSASATGGAQTYGWPAAWTLVPGNTLWQYMASSDGSGNGLLQNPSQAQNFTATPAMISAAAGNPATVISTYLSQQASMAPGAYGAPGGGYGDDSGSGLTNPEVAADGTPIDPATGLPQTGVDQNGNPIVQQGSNTIPNAPAPVAAPKKVNWLLAGGAALAVPAYMWMRK